MSIVYLVTSEEFYGEKIRGVFSTVAKAKEYMDRRVAETEGRIDALILEMVIDDPDAARGFKIAPAVPVESESD